MGDAQIAQYLSAGVAGAPQRGQIMFTLLVRIERRGFGGKAPIGTGRRGTPQTHAPWSTPGSIPCSLGRGSRRSTADYPAQGRMKTGKRALQARSHAPRQRVRTQARLAVEAPEVAA
jgi:hypothetical protein